MMSASRIVVGIDDTPTARAALRWAAQQARIIGATVRAVHVIDWPIGIEAYGSVELDEDGHLPEEKVSANRRGIRRVFEEASQEPGWQLQFAEGETGPVLIAEATDADLLVIGTRTTPPDWTGDIAGPVAHHCLSRTTCPVVTVPLERGPERQ
jgi:nucleotide-binding universal stress UspA family protein